MDVRRVSRDMDLRGQRSLNDQGRKQEQETPVEFGLPRIPFIAESV